MTSLAPPRYRQPGHLERAALWLGLAASAVGAAVLFFFDPRSFHFYPICLFHQTTGWLCPGCGSLRACHQLLHGRFATAFRFNPLLAVSCLPLTWCTLRHFLRRLRNQPGSFMIPPAWLWTFGAVAIVFTVLRNLPGAPFTWLRP